MSVRRGGRRRHHHKSVRRRRAAFRVRATRSERHHPDERNQAALRASPVLGNLPGVPDRSSSSNGKRNRGTNRLTGITVPLPDRASAGFGAPWVALLRPSMRTTAFNAAHHVLGLKRSRFAVTLNTATARRNTLPEPSARRREKVTGGYSSLGGLYTSNTQRRKPWKGREGGTGGPEPAFAGAAAPGPRWKFWTEDQSGSHRVPEEQALVPDGFFGPLSLAALYPFGVYHLTRRSRVTWQCGHAKTRHHLQQCYDPVDRQGTLHILIGEQPSFQSACWDASSLRPCTLFP